MKTDIENTESAAGADSSLSPCSASVLEKYRAETIRHAANAGWNMLSVVMIWYDSLPKQGQEALLDTRALLDEIVHSDAAGAQIGKPNDQAQRSLEEKP